MKNTILFMFASLASLLGDTAGWTDEDRKIEMEQVALWKNNLAEVTSKPPNVKFAELWLGLRNLGHRISFQGHSPEVDNIYEKIQTEFLSIPGHAEYFDKRIREAYEPLKGPDPGAAINGAQNEMMYGFETLKNLPSPETVKVLGGMLSETWRMKRLPPLPGDIRYTPPSLALAAVAGAFIQMPLREPPHVRGVMAWEDPEVVMVGPWQNWWEEVKSGKRNFSFKGQSVEYRFNPDGTWQTLAMVNPPDDGPKPEPSMPRAASPEKNPPPSPKSPSPPASERAASPSTSGWIIGCGILVLAVLAIFLKRRHAS